jgi:hypothetical protein
VTTEQIIQIAQAGGLVLLVASLMVGQLWAKPGVDFLREMLAKFEGMLAASLAREDKLADALRENTAAMREAITELRERKGAR